MMTLDLTKDRAKLRELYSPPSDEFVLVDVPELPFAQIEGYGDPSLGAGAQAVKDLYTAILPIRRAARARLGAKFVEPPVEFAYWAEDMGDLRNAHRDDWHWRAMITLPATLDEAGFEDSVTNSGLTTRPETLEMVLLTEGLCVQTLHRGESGIEERLAQLYNGFLPEHGLTAQCAYHEIYLDDWSRTAPEKRKVILRQPVVKKG